MDILAAMRQRFSVRSYTDRPVEPSLITRLVDLAGGAQRLDGPGARVGVVEGRDQVNRVLTFTIGSYGLVQNAPALMVGILAEESESCRVGLGYLLEQVVLEATRLELGSCWIAGSFDAQKAGAVVSLADGETAAAVCALGYSTEEGIGRLHTKLVRRLAGGHKRKPLSEIVFSEHWGKPWSVDQADPALVTIMEHARLAPSAHNGQPWRFMVRRDAIVLAIAAPRFVDAGIVMSHITLAGEAVGRHGEWLLQLRDESLRDEFNLPRRLIPVGTFQFSSG